jgi:hypothetical protein
LLVCNWLHFYWTKSLICNNAFYQGFSYFQSDVSRRFCTNSKPEESDPLYTSERHGIPFGHSSVKHHPFGRWELFIPTSLCVQKLRTIPGCICSDVSVTRLDAFRCLTSKGISFQNTNMGRQQLPSGQYSVLFQTLSLIRQVVLKKFNHPKVSLHDPDT